MPLLAFLKLFIKHMIFISEQLDGQGGQKYLLMKYALKYSKLVYQNKQNFGLKVNLDIFYVKMFIIVLSCIFFLFGHEIQQRLQLLYLIFYERKNFICSLEKLDFFCLQALIYSISHGPFSYVIIRQYQNFARYYMN